MGSRFWESNMKIDVIIPVYRPGKEFFELLNRLGEQTMPPNRIILMNTEEAIWEKFTAGKYFSKEYPNVEVHHLAKQDFDHGGTRHAAVQYSDADIFVAMTQDAMPADDYLIEKLVQHLRGYVAVSYARQIPRQDAKELEKISREFNYPPQSEMKSAEDFQTMGIKTFFCSNVCAAYRREIYDELRGFMRHTIFNEDMFFASMAVHAGYSISYEAEARVIHSHNYSNLMQFRRNFDIGVSQTNYEELLGGASSESEGKRLVASTWKELVRRRKIYLFPAFVVQCGCKYLGYKLGRNYQKLSRKQILRITMNREFWK